MATPRKSIQEYCLWCSGDNMENRKECPKNDCPLLAHRLGHGPGSKVKPIRARCLDCSETQTEVKECPMTDCKLWPFRMGKNPNKARPDLKGIVPKGFRGTLNTVE